MKLPTYRIYGVAVDSDVALPELDGFCAAPETQPHIHSILELRRVIPIETGRVFLRVDEPDLGEWLVYAHHDAGYLMNFTGLATFLISKDGSRIECCGNQTGGSAETLRHLLLDAVLPRVLDLHGIEALHATAVLTPWGACAFVGPSGCGKSTLAASFALAGFPLLGDDCVVLSIGEPVMLTPGYPGTRLWDDSYNAVVGDGVESGLVADYTSKRRALSLNRIFRNEPQPLRRIYRLIGAREGECASPSITQVSRAEAFIELSSASYRFNPLDHARQIRKFRFLEKLLAGVEVKNLLVPNDFESLGAVREMVLADVSGDRQQESGKSSHSL